MDVTHTNETGETIRIMAPPFDAADNTATISVLTDYTPQIDVRLSLDALDDLRQAIGRHIDQARLAGVL